MRTAWWTSVLAKANFWFAFLSISQCSMKPVGLVFVFISTIWNLKDLALTRMVCLWNSEAFFFSPDIRSDQLRNSLTSISFRTAKWNKRKKRAKKTSSCFSKHCDRNETSHFNFAPCLHNRAFSLNCNIILTLYSAITVIVIKDLINLS